MDDDTNEKAREATLISEDGEAVVDEAEDLHAEAFAMPSISKEIPSWTYYAVLVVLVLIVLDYLLSLLGERLFWSERIVYLTSYAVRWIVLLVTTFFFHNRFFAEHRTMFFVNGMVGFLSGMWLGIIRFVTDSSFWTVINIVVEPIDSALLALLASYIVYHLTLRLKNN